MNRSNLATGLASLLFATLVLASAPALADCAEPPPPAIPDGATAEKDEMLAIYRDMRSYQGDAQAYLDCLDAQTIANPDVEPEVMLDRLNAYNRTVEKMDEISREVHRQLDIFNAR